MKLNIEQGNLPTWAEREAERLAAMKVFQDKPTGYAKTARVRAINAMRRRLEEAGVTSIWQTQVVGDVLDLVRLQVNAE